MNNKILVLSLKDIAVYVVRRWRVLLIAAVILALVVGGYKTVTSYISSEDPYSEENKQALASKLTETEYKEVDNLFNGYLAYKKRIAFSESYLSNSLLMKLDPEALPSLTVQYSVSSDHYMVMSSFSSQSLSVSDYDKIASIIGSDVDGKNISEIISISNAASSFDNKEGISIEVEEKSSYTGIIDNVYKSVLSINVYSYTEEQCEKIMNIIEDAIHDQYQKLLDAGIDVTITRIGSNYTENSSLWLANHQREMISVLSSLKTEYDTFEKNGTSNLTGDEKAFFNFLKNQYEGKYVREGNLKYYVAGGFSGIALALITVLLLYFCSSRIRNKEDYIYRSDSDDVLGIIYTVADRKGIINRIVNKKLNKVAFGIGSDSDVAENTLIVSKRIRQICSRKEIDELYFVDDSSADSAGSVLSAITTELTNDGITVTSGKPLLASKDLDEFEKVKAVIYYGSFYDSKAEMLSDYRKLFEENNALVLGSVLHGEI